MSEYQSVLTAAAQLSVADRLRLIDDLAATVPDDEPFALSQEWLAEIERRCEEIESGAIAVVPWEEAQGRLRKAVGLDGAN